MPLGFQVFEYSLETSIVRKYSAIKYFQWYQHHSGPIIQLTVSKETLTNRTTYWFAESQCEHSFLSDEFREGCLSTPIDATYTHAVCEVINQD